jgi:hypothetical protein
MSAIGSSQPTLQASATEGSGASQDQFVRLSPFLLAAILVLAALLRFHQIDHTSLWSDEGNTWALVQRSFEQIARDAAADIHPPGYYWLLKLWAAIFGHSAASLRSFSALCGVLLVFVIERVARSIAPLPNFRWLPPLAAFIAALNPFQVYYSQEARMYMLLALVSAGLFWAMLAMIGRWGSEKRQRFVSGPEVGYVVCGLAGLWIHYTFPVILAAAVASFYLLRWQWTRREGSMQGRVGLRFFILNGLIALAYLPWAATAVERVLSWPKGGESASFMEGVALIARTLLFGPLRVVPEPVWPWLVLAVAAPLIGIVVMGRAPSVWAPVIWLAAPIVLMFGVGLFSEAFLKFLLVASAPWCVLVGATSFSATGRMRWVTLSAAVILATLLALLTLPAYYTSVSARDNYKGVAAYLATVGDPATDLVLLDAPGQSDVWRYYDPGLAVAALPSQRPPDPEQTIAELVAAVAGRRNIYGLFWATDEADPQRLVESWLDQNTFKGLESWQGNVRFAHYVHESDIACLEGERVELADSITLTGQCQPAQPQRVPSGDVALVQLRWLADAPISQRYKVSVQLLDARGQVIAQHDSEPAGGSRPTTTWAPGEEVTDNHGVAVPIGAPPGAYKLAAVVYNGATGERLVHDGGEMIDLGVVEVARPERVVPADLLPMQQRLDARLGPVVLLGADAYKKGFAHAPATPLTAGDILHVTLYWQAPTPLPIDWPPDQSFTLSLGDQELVAPLAGGAYPTGKWQAGDLIRGEFDIVFHGAGRRPVVSIGDDEVELAPLLVASAPESFP